MVQRKKRIFSDDNYSIYGTWESEGHDLLFWIYPTVLFQLRVLYSWDSAQAL